MKKRTFDSKMNDKITFKVPIVIQEEFRARQCLFRRVWFRSTCESTNGLW